MKLVTNSKTDDDQKLFKSLSFAVVTRAQERHLLVLESVGLSTYDDFIEGLIESLHHTDWVACEGVVIPVSSIKRIELPEEDE